MAHFRGTIQGNRGGASRLGTAKSGLDVTANGWNGGIRVELWVQDGVDMANVELNGGSGRGSGKSKLIFRGPINGTHLD